MTAAAGAAGTPGGQKSGGQHEQAGVGVEIAGLIRGERGGVRGEDLGAARMTGRQAGRMRLGEGAGRQRETLHTCHSNRFHLTLGVK